MASKSLEGGLMGAFAAGVTAGIGLGGVDGGTMSGFMVRAVAGGGISVLQGGKFGHGFAAAGTGMLVGNATAGMRPGSQFVLSTLAGGAASRATGGKFANGAVSAAMAYVFAQVNRGPSGRSLTEGEIELFQGVFGDDLDWNRVRIRESSLITDLGGAKGVVIGNTIHVHPDYYHSDFSLASTLDQAFMAHELTHVWQFQNVSRLTPVRAMIEHVRFSNPYRYDITSGSRTFDQFGLEQQGSIVENYFIYRANPNTPPALIRNYEQLIYGPGGIRR